MSMWIYIGLKPCKIIMKESFPLWDKAFISLTWSIATFPHLTNKGNVRGASTITPEQSSQHFAIYTPQKTSTNEVVSQIFENQRCEFRTKFKL